MDEVKFKNTNSIFGKWLIGFYSIGVGGYLLWSVGFGDIWKVLLLSPFLIIYVFVLNAYRCWDVTISRTYIRFDNNWLLRKRLFEFTDVDKIEISKGSYGRYLLVHEKWCSSPVSYLLPRGKNMKSLIQYLLNIDVSVEYNGERLFDLRQFPPNWID